MNENRVTSRESASDGSGVVGGAMARVRSGSWAGAEMIDEMRSAKRTMGRCFGKNKASYFRLERSAMVRPVARRLKIRKGAPDYRPGSFCEWLDRAPRRGAGSADAHRRSERAARHRSACGRRHRPHSDAASHYPKECDRDWP